MTDNNNNNNSSKNVYLNTSNLPLEKKKKTSITYVYRARRHYYTTKLFTRLFISTYATFNSLNSIGFPGSEL